jgi:ABC-type sugar transport system ATPase subunit
MAAMKKFLTWLGWVDFKKAARRGEEMVKALNIKTPSLEQKVKFLSGGNQQKVVIGKWLTADTDILIFDEPTRGIDVGAKSEIYKLLNDLAHQAPLDAIRLENDQRLFHVAVSVSLVDCRNGRILRGAGTSGKSARE